MGVELGSGVAVQGTGCVVLEFGGNEFGCRFCRMVPANAGHRVILQVLESDTDAGGIGLVYPVVTTYESGQRDGFRSRECPIPSGAVFHRLYRLAIRVCVFIGGALPHELFAGLWVLALAQGGKVLGGNRARQPECCATNRRAGLRPDRLPSEP
jgi:hypothetical protein